MSIEPSVGDPSAWDWVKSSYSAGDSNECVEVAHTPAAARTGFVAHAVTS